MSLLATTTLGLLLPAAAPLPQDQDPGLPTVLSEREQESLNKKARAWIETRMEYDQEPDRRRRQKMQRKLQSDEEKFLKDFERLSKRNGELLAQVGDLKAIFQDVFPYDRESGSGNVKTNGERGEPQSALLVPRDYDEEIGIRSILLIPPLTGEGWADAGEYIEKVWKESPLAEDTIVVAPKLPSTIELDPMPELGKQSGQDAERARIGAVFLPFGDVIRGYNLDRERTFLDCAAGSSAFGLRLASYFPDRFAGIVLRSPTDTESLRLGSLTGLPILALVDGETKAAAEALKAKLGDSVTILEGKGAAPFAESAPEISEWIGKQQRQLFRSSVVIEPNNDLFKGGYWVEIGSAEPLDAVKPEDRAMIKVVADRESNKITVETKSVATFTLMLNDAIVDLSKPFTVVVNGVAVQEQKTRDLDFMVNQMSRKYDPGFLFTALFGMKVPEKEETKEAGGN